MLEKMFTTKMSMDKKKLQNIEVCESGDMVQSELFNDLVEY